MVIKYKKRMIRITRHKHGHTITGLHSADLPGINGTQYTLNCQYFGDFCLMIGDVY